MIMESPRRNIAWNHFRYSILGSIVWFTIRKCFPQSRLALVQEFVVEDAGRKLGNSSLFWSRLSCRILFLRIFGPGNASLAKHVAVFLPGDLFRHLEDHFHQRVVGKALRTLQKHARLAEVGDRAFVPASQVLYAIANRDVEL